MIDTAEKYFTLDIYGKHQKNSVDRLKPPHMSTPVLTQVKKSQLVPVPTTATTNTDDSCFSIDNDTSTTDESSTDTCQTECSVYLCVLDIDTNAS